MELLDVKGLLPNAIQQILDSIGVVATLQLVKVFGGGTFRVPLRRSQAGEVQFQSLAREIGDEAAMKMVDLYGNRELYIALCDEALRELRNRQIRADFDRLTQKEGHGAMRAVAALAPLYRKSDRMIWMILKETDRHGRSPESQATLF